MKRPKLTKETYGGEVYEYYPLGKHIVSCPEVCGGRPTFKYTRVEVAFILGLLKAGRAVDSILANHEGRISREAVFEAFELAGEALEARAVRELKARPRRLPRRVRVS
jgi:uncharacterized protein (DUF433 family)